MKNLEELEHNPFVQHELMKMNLLMTLLIFLFLSFIFLFFLFLSVYFSTYSFSASTCLTAPKTSFHNKVVYLTK